MLDPVEQQWAYELQDIVLAHIELSDYLKHGEYGSSHTLNGRLGFRSTFCRAS